MKYWRGYLVAAILAVIAWALEGFAKAHRVLVDMIYPYVSRLVISTLAEWSAGSQTVLWQLWLLLGLLVIAASIGLMIWRKWSPIQWLGWVLAGISFLVLLNTGIYGLNQYASPLADDVRLQITDYTVSELNQATLFFRDKANELASSVPRDSKGNVDIGSFEELAAQAANGYQVLTYDEAISVFAGSSVPVKKLGWFRTRGDTGITVALTGEACVNPNVPNACLSFAMCKEMAHRMCIYSEADANFSAFLAGISNESPVFQYSAYLMAYHYCYQALSDIPTSTAKACAAETDSGVNQLLRSDLKACQKFFGDDATAQNVNTENEQAAISDSDGVSLIVFSEYSGITDLLASWYIQNYIAPTQQEEELPFDPYASDQVDLSGLVNAPTTAP